MFNPSVNLCFKRISASCLLLWEKIQSLWLWTCYTFRSWIFNVWLFWKGSLYSILYNGEYLHLDTCWAFLDKLIQYFLHVFCTVVTLKQKRVSALSEKLLSKSDNKTYRIHKRIDKRYDFFLYLMKIMRIKITALISHIVAI